MDLTGDQTAEVPRGHVPTAAQASFMRAGGTRLLVAGFLGSHALGLLTILAFAVTGGAASAVSAALGVVVVLLYRVLGQWVTLRAAGAGTQAQLAVAMGSLGLRVAALLLLVAVWFSLPPEVAARFDVLAVALGVLAGELGWLAGLLVRSLRSRVPVYDEADRPAPAGAEPAGGHR